MLAEGGCVYHVESISPLVGDFVTYDFRLIGAEVKGCRMLGGIAAEIPPPVWASGGLEVVPIKLPLSLPSPRASDPVGLDHSGGFITFAKPHKTLSESLQKREPDRHRPSCVLHFFFAVVTSRSVPKTQSATSRTENTPNTPGILRMAVVWLRAIFGPDFDTIFLSTLHECACGPTKAHYFLFCPHRHFYDSRLLLDKNACGPTKGGTGCHFHKFNSLFCWYLLVFCFCCDD